ncbi:MAG: DUF1007 family protein [Spirochaetales bacterium]|nr:DUF1007 family protein [Spirochaetales bacterium]
MRINIKKLLFCYFFLIAQTSASAHPHVFIENSFTFVFNDRGLSGIHINWILDEMFSATIIMDYDWNKNAFFEDSEIQAVKQGAFTNLKNYNYFLHINIDYVNFNITYATDFRAEIVNNRVVYSFFIPVNVQAVSTVKIISAGCYDETYFCDISYSKVYPVRLKNNSRYDCSWEIVDDKKNAYWGGFIIPKIVILKLRKKND